MFDFNLFSQIPYRKNSGPWVGIYQSIATTVPSQLARFLVILRCPLQDNKCE